jgi:hypothetical protein
LAINSRSPEVKRAGSREFPQDLLDALLESRDRPEEPSRAVCGVAFD